VARSSGDGRQGDDFRLRANGNFLSRFRLIWVVQSRREKFSHLCRRAKHLYDLAPFLPARGAFRDRHERWAGMRWTSVMSLDGRRGLRTAKSCGPDTPTLVSNWRQFPLMTGARKPGPRGEREGNRKTIVQGMPADLGVPVVTTLVCFLSLRTRLWVRP
jgi:hypothetical protein